MSLLSLFSQSLAKSNFVFFDFETTGKYPLVGEKVVELAMIKTSKGNIVDTFEMKFNPGFKMSEEVINIHHITDEMVKDEPKFSEEIALKILDFISGSTLVAHNVAFDLGFLSAELATFGITFEGWQAIDTLKIARHIFPGQKNNLKSLIQRYNISTDGDLHRALVDTEALKKLFFEMVDEAEIRGKSIDEIIKKFGFYGKFVHHSIPAKIREAMVEHKIVDADYKARDSRVVKIKFQPISAVWNSNNWFIYAIEVDTNNKLYLYGPHFQTIYDED